MKKKRLNKSNIIVFILFFLGLSLISYPYISQQYYTFQSTGEINDFIENVNNLDENDIKERLNLARAYNKTLDPSRLSDPYSEIEKKGIQTYARMLEVKEKIGFVEIPKIDQSLPIYAGTSEEVLNKGVGHLEGTSLPVGGESTHSVITAHRGLPSARLFTDLDKMEIGDIYYIHILNQVLAYKVDQILVVEPTDFEPVLVVEGKDYSTLLTCTPYSINSHRLLVRGERIPYTAPVKEKNLPISQTNFIFKFLLRIAVFIIILLLFIIFKYYLGIKSEKKRRL